MFISLVLGAAVAAAVPTTAGRDVSPIAVSQEIPQTAGAAVLSPFVSFSIEFSSFPDFAGMFVQAAPRKLPTNSFHRKLIQAKQVLKESTRQPRGSARREALSSSRWKHAVCISITRSVHP
jgi:hypothetical protein